MTTRETKQPAVGEWVAKLRVTDQRAREGAAFCWENACSVEAINMGDKFWSIHCDILAMLEGVGAAAAESETCESQIESGSSPAPGSANCARDDVPQPDQWRGSGFAERPCSATAEGRRSMSTKTMRGGSRQQAGSVALTWTVEPPKRRGEWWWEPPDNRNARVVFIRRYEGYLIARGRTMSSTEMSRPCEFLGGRWAGPLSEPLDAPGGGGGGSENLPTAEEKYNGESSDAREGGK